MMPLMTDDRISILDFLLDDHFALWDFADSFPEMRPDAIGSKTSLLLDLTSDGLIEIAFGEWFENETTPLPIEKAKAALLDAASWNRTGREPGYVIELTQSGRDHLRQSGISLPM